MMFLKYLGVVLFSTVLIQASPKLFESYGDQIESFGNDCKAYQKVSTLPKRIKKECKAYISKMNATFRYGHKLDSSVDQENVDIYEADKYHILLRSLEDKKENILGLLDDERRKAFKKNKIEYYKHLILSNQLKLYPVEYKFMETRQDIFSEHPRYIKYKTEQAKQEEIWFKKKQEAIRITKEQAIARIEKERKERLVAEEKEDARLKKAQKEAHAIEEDLKKRILLRDAKKKSTCQKVIVLHPAEYIADQYGKSVKWIYASGKKINIWQKPTSRGKGKKVGEMRIGSHARIILERSDDYKIVSPLDKSIGWVNKIQVSRTQYQDSLTHEICKKNRRSIKSKVPNTPKLNKNHARNLAKIKRDRQRSRDEINKRIQELEGKSSNIMSKCKAKWGTNYNMIKYCVDNQTRSYNSISNLPDNEIMSRCRKKWGTNYNMIKYCVDNQTKSKRSLGL